MRRPSYIFLLFILSTSYTSGQNTRLDSLITAFNKNTVEDTNKIKTSNLICWEYFITSDYKESAKYAEQSILLAGKLNFLKGKAEAINYLGNIHAQKAEYSEALSKYNESLKIKIEIDDIKGQGAAYNNIGNVQCSLGNLAASLENHFKSLKIREKLGNKNNISQSYANISNVYKAQKNNDKALDYALKALEIQKNLENDYALGMTFNNIGGIYDDMKDYAGAIENHLLSLKYKEKIGDKYGIALSYYNIGGIQYRTKNFKAAEENSLKSLQISEEIGDNLNTARAYIQLGFIQNAKKNYPDAKTYFDKALKIGLQTNSKPLIRDLYLAELSLDSLTSNWKSAFLNLQQFVLYRDSIVNDENSKAIAQQQMQFEFDKKEALLNEQQANERALANADKKQQNIIIGFAAVGIIVLVYFLVSSNKRQRLTQKQKMLIEEQKNTVDEKQKEILDSIHYAKRIQSSLLPTEKYIEKSINRLANK